jgi:hypothetical protein
MKLELVVEINSELSREFDSKFNALGSDIKKPFHLYQLERNSIQF